MSSSNFKKAIEVTAVPKGAMRSIMIGGKEIMVVNVGGNLYALDNKCTHMGGPLAKGKLDGFVVTCPWHGSQFDVRTGTIKRGPAQKTQPTHAVKV